MKQTCADAHVIVIPKFDINRSSLATNMTPRTYRYMLPKVESMHSTRFRSYGILLQAPKQLWFQRSLYHGTCAAKGFAVQEPRKNTAAEGDSPLGRINITHEQNQAQHASPKHALSPKRLHRVPRSVVHLLGYGDQLLCQVQNHRLNTAVLLLANTPVARHALAKRYPTRFSRRTRRSGAQVCRPR